LASVVSPLGLVREKLYLPTTFAFVNDYLISVSLCIIHQRIIDAAPMTTTIGVLALQGGFSEHLFLLRKAAQRLQQDSNDYALIEVRNPVDLARCDALIIPGGESTTIAYVAAQSDLLEPLRHFVKYVPACSPRLRFEKTQADELFSESRESPRGEHVLV
jgi:hypothetical protein